MSHAIGEVIHGNKIVGFYEYNGTADIAYNRIFDSKDELWEKFWRTPAANSAKCTCGKNSVAVVLYSDYGNGFYWNSHACLECHCITGNKIPFEENTPTTNGHPL